MKHNHSKAVFIATDGGTCVTCGASAKYGWFLREVGTQYCPDHAPDGMVEAHKRFQQISPKDDCIYCDNPSRPFKSQ